MTARLKAALIVGTLTMVLDLIFHILFTFPEEVFDYFLAKFLIAFFVAYIFLPKIGPLKAALYFTILFSVLYYFVGVYLLQIPGLSIYTESGYISIFGTSNLIEVGIIEFFIHGLFFFIAALSQPSITREIDAL